MIRTANSSQSRTTLGAATLTAGHGGIARVARMCARALIERGEKPALIAFLDPNRENLDGYPVTGCHGSKINFTTRVHRSAVSGDHFLYDSLGMGRAHPFLPGLNRPFATWMHGQEVFEGMRAEYERVLRRADLVLVNSEYTLARHQNLFGPLPQAKMCWLATEQDEPPELRAAFCGPPSVLIVGRIDASERGKGHAELLDVWPDVIAAVPGARLLIAGSGSGLDGLRDRLRNDGLTASVDLLGFVAEEEMSALFARSHVYAMPSQQEGFGIAYIEAMRHGLPVIASLQDAGQEVNVDGETGYNIDLDRPAELRERLIALLRSPDLAASMGSNGFRRWQADFCYSRFADRFIDIWQDFAGWGADTMGNLAPGAHQAMSV